MIGTAKQIKATVRHAINVLRKKIKNIPNVTLMLVYAIKIPRVDGSLHDDKHIFLIRKMKNIWIWIVRVTYHISPRYL